MGTEFDPTPVRAVLSVWQARRVFWGGAGPPANGGGETRDGRA